MIPQTEQALLEKAQSIAGLTFGELADELNIPVPPDLKRDKGWVGMLLETALGATAGSKAEQDFSNKACSVCGIMRGISSIISVSRILRLCQCREYFLVSIKSVLPAIHHQNR